MEPGPLLRKQRELAGLSQDALARTAGTSQATISAYETGRKVPSSATLSRLIKACGATLGAEAHDHRHASPLLAHVLAHRKEVRRITESLGGSRVAVFGSVARGDDNDDSDVDLLVELAPDRDLLDVMTMEQELTDLLGVRVDVTSRRVVTGDGPPPVVAL